MGNLFWITAPVTETNDLCRFIYNVFAIIVADLNAVWFFHQEALRRCAHILIDAGAKELILVQQNIFDIFEAVFSIIFTIEAVLRIIGESVLQLLCVLQLFHQTFARALC